jgi:hypothetical protein
LCSTLPPGAMLGGGALVAKLEDFLLCASLSGEFPELEPDPEAEPKDICPAASSSEMTVFGPSLAGVALVGMLQNLTTPSSPAEIKTLASGRCTSFTMLDVCAFTVNFMRPVCTSKTLRKPASWPATTNPRLLVERGGRNTTLFTFSFAPSFNHPTERARSTASDPPDGIDQMPTAASNPPEKRYRSTGRYWRHRTEPVWPSSVWSSFGAVGVDRS